MTSVPLQILLGIYLGILTGIIPALAAWALGFSFKYFTGVTIPGFGVVVLAVALAGVSGGLLALADPAVTESAQAPTVVTSILVVTALSLYAHSKGDALGANVPKRLSFSNLRNQRLHRDVIELVGGRDEVRIRVTGAVSDMEGYPPLSDDLRAEIQSAEYTFPAELRVAELEERLAERLRTEFDLGDVVVRLDERGRASVTAAPPFSGLSKRIPAGKRAVSITGLIPTGLARGDEVRLLTAEGTASGTVVSARSGDQEADRRVAATSLPDPDTEAGSEDRPSKYTRAPTTTGGEGRLTAAVSRADADSLLGADEARIVVESQGTRLEYELLSLLRRAGKRFRKLTVASGGVLDGQSLGAANVRETYGVAVLAVRRSTGWELVPRGSVELTVGDDLYAVGTRESLDSFAEAIA